MHRNAKRQKTRIHVTLALSNGGNITADDIALIETIQRCRTILGASKLLGISYRKTWTMAHALNSSFESKVFDTLQGRTGAGTVVTPFGERLAALFRAMERRSAAASSAAMNELAASLDWSFSNREASAGGDDTA
jgi:molybdate transport system regulatory protein